MKPIENWDNVEAIVGGSYPKLPAGGYVCRIVTAREELSKASGKRMLVFAIDIAEGEYKDFFLNQFNSRLKTNEKATWGQGGIYRQVVEGDSVGRFKGMIQVLEESNKGWVWDWNENNMKGLLVGGLFREEEYIGNDGKVHSNVKCISFLPVEGIENVAVPEKKCVEPMQQSGMSEEIPF